MPAETKLEAQAESKARKYVVLPWTRRERPAHLAWRAPKMVAPVCKVCQDIGTPRWWETCSHNPYVSNVREDVATPVIVCTNGHEVAEGALACGDCGSNEFEQTGEKLKPTFRTQPNTREVRLDESANSGRSPEIMKNSKGYKFPSELGIAPMCDYSRCYESLFDEFGKQRPGVVNTKHGNYCMEDQAKLVALFLDGEAVEIFNERIKRQQLRNVAL